MLHQVDNKELGTAAMYLVIPGSGHHTALEVVAPKALAFEIDFEGTVWGLFVKEDNGAVPWPELEWVNLTRESGAPPVALRRS